MASPETEIDHMLKGDGNHPVPLPPKYGSTQPSVTVLSDSTHVMSAMTAKMPKAGTLRLAGRGGGYSEIP